MIKITAAKHAQMAMLQAPDAITKAASVAATHPDLQGMRGNATSPRIFSQLMSRELGKAFSRYDASCRHKFQPDHLDPKAHPNRAFRR